MTALAAQLARLGRIPLGVACSAVVAYLLIYGGHREISWIALVAAMVASWELGVLLGRDVRQRCSYVLAVALGCLLAKAILSGSRESVNEFLLLALMLWALAAPVWLVVGKRPYKTVVAALGGFIIVSAWLSVAVLAEFDRWTLVTGVAAVIVADSTAWLVGGALGRTPLAPRLSPNKTWEGALGALLALYLLATFVWWAFLTDSYPHWLMLVVAAAICALAILGDLVESALKRQAGVKDSGTVMGSHGGMMDRIDSWLAVLPFMALLSSLAA